MSGWGDLGGQSVTCSAGACVNQHTQEDAGEPEQLPARLPCWLGKPS